MNILHDNERCEMWRIPYKWKTRKKVQPAAASNIEIKLLKSCCQRMVFLPNCARLLFPHFFIASLISNNAVSSDIPNASQAPFVANQRTNHLLISQSTLNDHYPALSKWMTSWLSGQPTKPPRLERWAIASHRLADSGQPSKTIRTRWLGDPKTIRKPSNRMIAPNHLIQW